MTLSNRSDIDSKWNKIVLLKSSLDYYERYCEKIRNEIQELAKA